MNKRAINISKVLFISMHCRCLHIYVCTVHVHTYQQNTVKKTNLLYHQLNRQFSQCQYLFSLFLVEFQMLQIESVFNIQCISLSTIVLNSRDWSEIVWLPKILHFNNQPCNRLYPKKPAGIHWLGYNDAVSWLNETKT